MPDFPGTIPAIKERPKVAKKPTIPAQPSPNVKERKNATKQAAAPVPVRPFPAQPVAMTPPPAAQVSDNAVAAQISTPAETAAHVSVAPASPGPDVKARRNSPAKSSGSVSTIPPVKQRPKVARRPTITAPATLGKKPLVKQKVEPREKQPTLPSNWINWAPLAIGIVLGFMAPQIHSMVVRWDQWGMRVVFPLVQLAGLHEIGLSDELTRTLPQLMLYLQFPLEGLLVASNLRRGMRFAAAFGPIPALHFVCGLVLWIVALGSKPPI